MRLKREEIAEIEQNAYKKLKLNCNEYHYHSIDIGCFSGPEDKIAIARLCLFIRKLLYRIDRTKEKFEKIFNGTT